MNPLTSIPALYRQRVYVAYAVAGILIGGVDVGFTVNPDAAVPHWLKVVLAVYAYLAIPLSGMAGSNVTSVDRPLPAPETPVHD